MGKLRKKVGVLSAEKTPTVGAFENIQINDPMRDHLPAVGWPCKHPLQHLRYRR